MTKPDLPLWNSRTSLSMTKRLRRKKILLMCSTKGAFYFIEKRCRINLLLNSKVKSIEFSFCCYKVVFLQRWLRAQVTCMGGRRASRWKLNDILIYGACRPISKILNEQRRRDETGRVSMAVVSCTRLSLYMLLLLLLPLCQRSIHIRRHAAEAMTP